MSKNEERSAEQITLQIFEELESLVTKLKHSFENKEENSETKTRLIEYMLHLVEELHKSEKRMVFWRSFAIALIATNSAIGIIIIILIYAAARS